MGLLRLVSLGCCSKRDRFMPHRKPRGFMPHIWVASVASARAGCIRGRSQTPSVLPVSENAVTGGYDRPEKLLAQRSQLTLLLALVGSGRAWRGVCRLLPGLVTQSLDETTSIGGQLLGVATTRSFPKLPSCRRPVVDVRKTDVQDGRFHRVCYSAPFCDWSVFHCPLRLLRKRRRSSAGLI